MCEKRRSDFPDWYVQEIGSLADHAQAAGNREKTLKLIEALYSIYDPAISGSLSALGYLPNSASRST